MKASKKKAHGLRINSTSEVDIKLGKILPLYKYENRNLVLSLALMAYIKKIDITIAEIPANYDESMETPAIQIPLTLDEELDNALLKEKETQENLLLTRFSLNTFLKNIIARSVKVSDDISEPKIKSFYEIQDEILSSVIANRDLDENSDNKSSEQKTSDVQLVQEEKKEELIKQEVHKKRRSLLSDIKKSNMM